MKMKRRSFLKTLLAAATIAVASKLGVADTTAIIEEPEVVYATTYYDTAYTFHCQSRRRIGTTNDVASQA